MLGLNANSAKTPQKLYIVIALISIVAIFLYIQAQTLSQNFKHRLPSSNETIGSDNLIKASYRVSTYKITTASIATTKKPSTIRKDFTRAAVVYFPAENEGTDEFNVELQWFERSWREMRKYESENWRTDIVVFTIKFTPVMKKLNCTRRRRKSRTEASRCIIIDNYIPVVTAYNLTYRPANSVNVAAVLNQIPDMKYYDWILRTDLDTFITPAFSTWRPKKMVVGIGAYEWGPGYITGHKLKRIADNLNLTSQNLTNIGSTWYGPLDLVAECGKLSMEIMVYLDKYEFTKLEKSQEFGTQGWPEWHYGVLTMYGGHLSVNHCTAKYGVEKNDTLLDWGSASTESIWVHPHIHTWHGREQFSKFAFFDGLYKNLSKLQINYNNSVRDYATYIALDSVDNPKMVQIN